MEPAENQPKNSRRPASGRPFKPGQSGNPAGRPKKAQCIPDALREIMAQQDPETRRTRFLNIMERIVRSAEKGEDWAVKFVAERTEGKVSDRVEVTAPGPLFVVGPPPAG